MRRINPTFLLGLVVAALGAAIVIAYGRSAAHQHANAGPTIPVLVAQQDLPAGVPAAVLTGHVAVEMVPARFAVASPLASLTAVSPQSVLQSFVAKGTELSAQDFAAATGQISSYRVLPAKGTVALAIQVGLVPGVAKYINPGDHVDMFFTYGKDTVAVTKLFASGVKVLSVTPAAAPTASPAAGQSGPPAGDQVLAVLQVSPALAQEIVNAVSTGQIYLGLDAPGDRHSTAAGITPLAVLNGASQG